MKTDSGWVEENDIIYFSVMSDGTTGEGWIARLEANDYRVGDDAKHMLLSKDFKPTSGVVTKIAVIKKDKNVNVVFGKGIRALATEHNFGVLNAEVACLIRDKFTDREICEMDLATIFVEHEHIKNLHGDPCLFYVTGDGVGRYLCSYCGPLYARSFARSGFAFSVLSN